MKKSTLLTYLGTSLLALFMTTANGKSIAPPSDNPVFVNTELAYPYAKRNQNNYIKVTLNGGNILQKISRTPINIALVIDRSGSMSGDKIAKARDAALMAVDMLGSHDILSVIGYDYSAEIIVPATKLQNKSRLKKIIRNEIQAEGNTALFAGVSKGIAEVNKFLSKNNVNRVILLSDGQANVGPSSSSELGELGISAAKQGIAVTTIGLGDGYNEDLMTTLAGYSDGNHFFAKNAGDLETAFNREFNDVMNVVAQEVAVTFKLNQFKPVRLLGRDGKISGRNVSVKLNQLYANQEKYILLEVEPTAKKSLKRLLGEVHVSYRLRGGNEVREHDFHPTVTYTSSASEVQEHANEDILADVFIQKSNFANHRAIEALDRGDKKQSLDVVAEAVLESEAYLQHLKKPEVRAKVSNQIKSLKEANQAIQAAPARNARKVLKENSYKTLKQQK